MRYTLATITILILWASLGLIGYRNGRRFVEIRPQVAILREAVQRRDDLDCQQIRICELALAGTPDTSTLESAEAKFKEIQERYGQLPIADPQQVSIVTVPELVFRERALIAWRIHVPPGQRVELTGYVARRESLSATDSSEDESSPSPDSFSKTLPAGESTILVEWKERYTYKWGSFDPDDSFATMVTVSVMGDEFRWQVNGLAHNQLFLRPVRYPQPQTLFASDNSTEIINVGAIHLLIRRADTIEGSEP